MPTAGGGVLLEAHGFAHGERHRTGEDGPGVGRRDERGEQEAGQGQGEGLAEIAGGKGAHDLQRHAVEQAGAEDGGGEGEDPQRQEPVGLGKAGEGPLGRAHAQQHGEHRQGEGYGMVRDEVEGPDDGGGQQQVAEDDVVPGKTGPVHEEGRQGAHHCADRQGDRFPAEAETCAPPPGRRALLLLVRIGDRVDRRRVVGLEAAARQEGREMHRQGRMLEQQLVEILLGKPERGQLGGGLHGGGPGVPA